MYPFQDDALAFLTLGAVLYPGGIVRTACYAAREAIMRLCSLRSLLTRDEADPANDGVAAYRAPVRAHILPLNKIGYRPFFW